MENKESPILEVLDLECRYHDQPILRNLSFAVYRGEMFFIVGRGGVGKTTLLRHLIGLDFSNAGNIRYFGENVSFGTFTDRRQWLLKCGVLFQNEGLWGTMTLSENINLPLEEYTKLGRQGREELIALKLAQVGLAGLQDRYPSELGKAMRKRAALARALALEPKLLICDEPTAGLDSVQARQMDFLLQDLREGLGISTIVLSDNLSSIMNLADRLIFLDGEKKGIVAEGSPTELAQSHADPHLQEFFNPEPSHSRSSR